MTNVFAHGRLGNIIIRNIAVSILAEKFDLCAVYANNDILRELGIHLFSGNKMYTDSILLTDDNYISIYNSTHIDYNLNPGYAFFQTKYITNCIYDYIHNRMKETIIEKNIFKYRYNTNNDAYIHIRLTDVEKYNPGVQYYLHTLQQITCDNIYISSDNIHHEYIKHIQAHYPNTILLEDYNESKTFQFASTCKYIILSHGSFSAIIGYLSFFSTIHYPEYQEEKMWYGDMFSIPGWIKHQIPNLHSIS